jgi:hypothetical protein
MDDLERRYRRLLRVLPASYRRGHEEEMVSTFLEVTAADRPSDSVRQETPGVLALALRLRMGLSRSTERARVRAQALHLVLLLGLFAMMVTYTFNALFLAWLQDALPWLPRPSSEEHGPTGLLSIANNLPVLACVALLALVLGHHRAGRLLALLYLVPTTLLELFFFGYGAPSAIQLAMPGIALIFDCLLVFAALTLDVDAPPVRRTPWLGAMASGLVLTCVVFVVTTVSEAPSLTNIPTNTTLGCGWLLVAALHWRRGLGGDRLPRTLGLALTGTFLTLFQFAWLAGIYSSFPYGFVVSEFPVDLGVGLALAVVCAAWIGPIRRELANLPDAPSPRERLSPAG